MCFRVKRATSHSEEWFPVEYLNINELIGRIVVLCVGQEALR